MNLFKTNSYKIYIKTVTSIKFLLLIKDSCDYYKIKYGVSLCTDPMELHTRIADSMTTKRKYIDKYNTLLDIIFIRFINSKKTYEEKMYAFFSYCKAINTYRQINKNVCLQSLQGKKIYLKNILKDVDGLDHIKFCFKKENILNKKIINRRLFRFLIKNFDLRANLGKTYRFFTEKDYYYYIKGK